MARVFAARKSHPRAVAGRMIEIAGGQVIALDEYGDPKGVPVFYCHGWPGSRLQAALLDRDARALGIRVLSPDRPGLGLSGSQPGRTLRDWPATLRALADVLGIERFHVLGVSGGGPYALASAWGLAERVRAVAVVCGAPPIADAADVSGLSFMYRGMLASYRRGPRLTRWLFRIGRPLATVTPPRWLRLAVLRFFSKPEAETLADRVVLEACVQNYLESWRGSANGVFDDAEIYVRPWGFPLEEIHVPVRLWHGKADRNFGWRHSHALAQRLPNCVTQFVENEAHFSLAIRRQRAILEDLLSVGA